MLASGGERMWPGGGRTRIRRSRSVARAPSPDLTELRVVLDLLRKIQNNSPFGANRLSLDVTANDG
jgi:hypothetical protein